MSIFLFIFKVDVCFLQESQTTKFLKMNRNSTFIHNAYDSENVVYETT